MAFKIGINLSLVGGGRTRPGSGVVLQSQTLASSGAVVNPNPTGTGEVSLASLVVDARAIWNPTGTGAIDLLAQAMAAAGAVVNPNPTGTGDIALAAQTIDASGVAISTLFSADFTTQSAGAGSVSSYGLSFARASSGHSVQTGTNTVSTSGTIGNNDVPRYGKRLDANNIGLVIEVSRLNEVLRTREIDDAAWLTNGSVTKTRPFGTSPDGGNTATRVQTSGAAAYTYQQNTTSVGSTYYTVWTQSVGGAVASIEIFDPSSGTSTTSTSWSRLQLSSATTPGYFMINNTTGPGTYPGDAAAGPRDSAVDFIQVEEGKYATEAIVNAGTKLTRSGERLFHPTGSNLRASDGSLRFYVKLRAKGSSSDYASDPRLWHVDANNHAEVVASTGAVSVTIGGSAYTTATAASWAKNDLLEFWVAAGGGDVATVVKYTVNGGSVTTLSTGSPPTQSDITISGSLDLLCNGTSDQFTSWCEKIETYPTGASPTGF